MKDPIFELVPGKGALPLLLGAGREDISRAMQGLGHGLSARHGDSDYYAGNAVQVEFDDDGQAWFIGISAAPGIELLYRGRNILPLPAREVFELLRENEPQAPIEYSPQEHLFRHQIITLWDADEQYDPAGRVPVWGQIGIGNASYLAAVEEPGA